MKKKTQIYTTEATYLTKENKSTQQKIQRFILLTKSYNEFQNNEIVNELPLLWFQFLFIKKTKNFILLTGSYNEFRNYKTANAWLFFRSQEQENILLTGSKLLRTKYLKGNGNHMNIVISQSSVHVFTKQFCDQYFLQLKMFPY